MERKRVAAMKSVFEVFMSELRDARYTWTRATKVRSLFMTPISTTSLYFLELLYRLYLSLHLLTSFLYFFLLLLLLLFLLLPSAPVPIQCG
jgi:hypothetical protein